MAGNMRHRNHQYVRTSVLLNNERALDRGAISLRQYLVASSRMMDVGVGAVVHEDEVPDAVQEVVVDVEPAPLLELATQPAIQTQPQPQPEHELHLRCGVCRENEPRLVLIPCGHVLCSDCINQLEREQQNQCPFCRAFVATTNQLYLN